MNIASVTNVNFNGRAPQSVLKKVTTFRVPGQNNTTIVANVEEVGSGMKEKIVGIDYKIMQKGKVLEEKSFHNKKGILSERLCRICEDIQKKVRDGFDFLDELLNAQLKGGN